MVDKDRDRLFVLPGYDRGSSLEDLTVRRILRAPHARDIAVLCLARPAKTRPLPLATDPPQIGELVLVIGYPRPRAQVQSRFVCSVLSRGPDDTVTLSCPMRQGASGAPVLRRTRTGFEVVGVMAASSRTYSLAYDVSRKSALPACN